MVRKSVGWGWVLAGLVGCSGGGGGSSSATTAKGSTSTNTASTAATASTSTGSPSTGTVSTASSASAGSTNGTTNATARGSSSSGSGNASVGSGSTSSVVASASSSGTSAGVSAGTSGGTSAGATTGSSGSSGAPPGSINESPEQRCLDVANAICNHDEACGDLATVNDALCLDAFNCENASLYALDAAQLDAGLTTQVSLVSCIEDIGDATCSVSGSQARTWSSDCELVAQGQQGAGGACQTTSDCMQPGFDCIRSTTTCGGVCTPWLTQGACGSGLPSVAVGYYCSDAGQVTAQLPVGQPCTADAQCDIKLECRGASGTQTCLPPGTGDAGAACTGSHDCNIGFGCVVPRGATAGTCIAKGSSCAMATADGGTVVSGELCPLETFCDRSNGDVCSPEATIGSACNPDGGHPKCLAGQCLSGNGFTCAYAGAGLPCQAATDCASGYCANPDGGALAYCAANCP